MAHMVHVNGEKAWFALAAAGATADQREIFLYLLMPPDSRTWAGVRRFLPGEVLPYMPGLDRERALAALESLQAAGLVSYDPQAQLIFTPLTLEMQPYSGHNAVAGAANGLADFPDSAILVPVLEHLVAAEAVAAVKARELAEAAKEGKPKDTATRQADQADELLRGLRDRLARLTAGATPSEGGSSQPQGNAQPPAKGVRRGFKGGSPGGEDRPESGAKLPETGPRGPIGEPGSPSEGGSGEVPHACARAGEPLPLPSPLPSGREPPPSPPAARGGPPQTLDQVLDKVGK